MGVLVWAHVIVNGIFVIFQGRFGNGLGPAIYFLDIRSRITFVMINGVSRSLPPTKRIPHGVCAPSRSNVTENSCDLCAISYSSK